MFCPSAGQCFVLSRVSVFRLLLAVDVTRVGCGCCGDCSTPGQSLICHTSSPASALPPLSAQISSNGRGACRTFLRSDGVTEAETQDPPMAPDPLPPFCQRTQSSTLGRRAEAGQALTVTGAAWPGCTQLHPSRGSVGAGVSVMQSWCGHREALREEAEGGTFPQECPSGLASTRQLDWGCLGTGWSYLELPHPSLFSPPPLPQVQRSTSPRTPWKPGNKPSSVQKPPKPW